MTDTAPLPPGALSGQVMFYQQPEPVEGQRHANTGVRITDRPYTFAANQHFIPVNVSEFGPSALSYPIVFAGDARSPLAVMGLNAGENLYISADGQFRPGCYVPSFLRRYPFVMAQDTSQTDRLLLCLDSGSDLITEAEPKMPLFENNQATPFLQNCLEFCRQFDVEQARTESFIKLLNELDLFELKSTYYTPPRPDGTQGEPQKVAEYHAVSEEKLKALPAEKYAELRDNGALLQIHAHIISLLGFDRLVYETLAKLAAAQPTAANA